MNIYVIYKDDQVINATPVPRVVMDAFKAGADTIQLWRNDKLIRLFKNAKDFNRFINPRPSEDEENGGNDYEW
jgi:hypothetical protein